ncbi:MAG: aminotransferase class III-fold pyridoxal phosphate-dependent enzyme [Halobacteriaceae archaeon]
MDRETAEPQVSDLPGDRADRWVQCHQRHAAPSTYVYDFVWDVTEPATGPFCTDVDGNVLMDFTAHVGAAPLGYNHPDLLDRVGEFDLVDPTKIAGQDFYVAGGWPPADPPFPGPTQLMDRLTDRCDHYGLDTVFLSNSGAEAVENALKICYDDRPRADHVITFTGAFHGRTLATLSLNRSKTVHRRWFPELPGVEAVPFCEDPDCSRSSCSCGYFPDGDAASALRRLFDERGSLDPESVAAVVIEPIQGEGGYRVPSDAFGADLDAVCADYDLPLVVDEVQAGMGRTGEWWGSDHFDFDPDVITAGKALRVGATVADADTFPDEQGRLSSTWGAGDLLASLQGVLTMDVIEDNDLLANATERGAQFRERLTRSLPAGAESVRGVGLMVAVHFDAAARRNAAMAACLERGLLTIGCGESTLRLLPPLDVTPREIDLAADLFLEAAREVAPA